METETESETNGEGLEPSVELIESVVAELATDETPIGDLYRSAVNAIGTVVSEAKSACVMGRGRSFRFSHIIGEELSERYVEASDAYIKAAGRYAKHLVTMAVSMPHWKTMGEKARRDIGEAADIAYNEMGKAGEAFREIKREVVDIMEKAEAIGRENATRIVEGVNGETENPPAEPDGEAGEE